METALQLLLILTVGVQLLGLLFVIAVAVFIRNLATGFNFAHRGMSGDA